MGDLAKLDALWCHLRYYAKKATWLDRLILCLVPMEWVEHGEGFASYKYAFGNYYLYKIHIVGGAL